MINLDITFEEMKEEIIFERYLLNETISPRDNPDKFVGFSGLDYISKNNLLVENTRCLSSKFISDVLGLYGSGNSFKDYFRELQYNSCMHGNKFDKNLPLKLKIGLGKKGLVGQIENEGKGFDYKKIIKRFNEKKEYSKNKGSGFRLFNQKSEIYTVSFEKKGVISNLMLKISEEDQDIWDNLFFLNN